MTTILIMYHPNFASRGKFERKLNRILSNIKNYKVIYNEDPRGLIASFFSEEQLIKVKTNFFDDYDTVEFTHAVFFDSIKKPYLLSLSEELSKKKLVRYIKDKITFVSNKDKGDYFDTYIGRGTLWGNPYSIGHDGDREDVIRKFQYDFDRNYLKDGEKFKEKLILLRGHTLGCHCKPFDCHGDVLAQFLNEMDDGE